MENPSPDSIRRDLADTAAAISNTERSAAEILRAAEQRRAMVVKRLDEMRAAALSDGRAADEYQALIEERGRLDLIIAHGG